MGSGGGGREGEGRRKGEEERGLFWEGDSSCLGLCSHISLAGEAGPACTGAAYSLDLFSLFCSLDQLPSCSLKSVGLHFGLVFLLFRAGGPSPSPQLPSTWVGHVLVVAVTALGSPSPRAATVGPRGLETTNDSLLMGSLPPACQPGLPFSYAQAGNHARPGNLSLPWGCDLNVNSASLPLIPWETRFI